MPHRNRPFAPASRTGNVNGKVAGEVFRMMCTKFQEQLMDIARGRNPSEAALAHAAACPDCARRLAEERSLSAALAALRQHTEHENTPPYLETSLVGRTPRSAAVPPGGS